MTVLVKPRALFIGLSLLCLLAIWLSLALGPVSLPLLDTLSLPEPPYMASRLAPPSSQSLPPLP